MADRRTIKILSGWERVYPSQKLPKLTRLQILISWEKQELKGLQEKAEKWGSYHYKQELNSFKQEYDTLKIIEKILITNKIPKNLKMQTYNKTVKRFYKAYKDTIPINDCCDNCIKQANYYKFNYYLLRRIQKFLKGKIANGN